MTVKIGSNTASTSVDKRGVWIPQGSLTNLKAALAAHASQLVEIPYFGDSTGAALDDTSGTRVGGPVVKLRTLALAAGLTDGGRGVAAAGETAAASGESLLPLVSKTGFAVVGNSLDYLNTETLVSTAANDTATWQGKGTYVRVPYSCWGTTTGRFTVTVDGGAATTIDASTTGANATSRVAIFGPFTEGTHTVVVTNLGNIPVIAPGQPLLGVSASGGTLGAGTYAYKATSVTGSGESTASVTSQSGVIGGGGTGSSSVSIPRVPGATSYNVYRSLNSGAYLLVGNVSDPGSGSFATFTDTTPGSPTTPPPGSSTAGFTGTTARQAHVVEFIRAAGIVFHKQSISGINSAAFFDHTRTATVGQCNASAQIALGLTPDLAGSSNACDWGQTPAARPLARNVPAAIFVLGLNDMGGNGSTDPPTAAVSTYVENFGLFVRLTRAAGADPILVVPHFNYYQPSTATNGSRFRDAVIHAARSHGVPYVDYNEALPPPSTGVVTYGAGPHIKQTGYDVEGQFLWDNLFAPAIAGSVG